MIGRQPIPELRVGDVITAEWLNSVRKQAIRGNAASRLFTNGAFTLQAAIPTVSPYAEMLSRSVYAIVTQTAGPNASSSGRCVLLNEELEPVDENGEVLILDPEDEAYDPLLIEAVEIVFYSIHTDSSCLTGARIRLSATIPIVPGAEEDDEHPIYGEHVDGSAYWEGHNTYEDDLYLGSSDGEVGFQNWTTEGISIAGSGDGECNEEGGLDITLVISSSGGPYVVPPNSGSS